MQKKQTNQRLHNIVNKYQPLPEKALMIMVITANNEIDEKFILLLKKYFYKRVCNDLS